MKDPVFWRLVWKEYRFQRGFWISMVVIALLAHLCVLAVAGKDVDKARTLLEIAWALSAAYALGCGATLFATEHEAETFDFQRALPVSPGRLFWAKMALAVAGTLAMIAVQWPLAAMMGGWQPIPLKVYGEIWASWGFGAVELLVWGTFFSLLLKRPLVAAVLAVLTASVTVHVIVAPFGEQYFRQPYVLALPYRCAFIALVAVVTVWMGFRWFRERPSRAAGAEGEYPPVMITDVAAAVTHAFGQGRGSTLRRLLWQQLRQSVWTLTLLTAMVVPLFVVAVFVGLHALVAGHGPARPSPGLQSSFALTVMLAMLAAPLAGACVFLGDQRRRVFRFLSERGVPPRSVWLSRQAIWGAPTLGYATVLSVLFFVWLLVEHGPKGVLSEPEFWQFIGSYFGFVLLAYAAGQLCSMFFASAILTLFFSIVLTIGLCYWAGIMYSLDVPWLWSALPIPLLLLFATWLRTPNWLLERNTLRAWAPIVLVLALPAIAIIAGVCAHRVYSVPLVDPGFDPQAFAAPPTPEARETAEMYRRALALYNPVLDPKLEETVEDDSGMAGMGRSSGPDAPLPAATNALLDQNQEAIRLTLEASQRPDCDFYDRTNGTSDGPRADDLMPLAHLLITSARRQQDEGDLDAALERYLGALRFSAHLQRGATSFLQDNWAEQLVYEDLPSWAAHTDQTPERIKGAIEQVEAAEQGMPVPSDVIKADYLKLKAKLDCDLAVRLSDLDYREGDGFVVALQKLPWEAGRSRRVLNLLTDRDLADCNQVESALRTGRPVEFPDFPRYNTEWMTYRRTTPWIRRFYGLPMAPSLTSRFVLTETRRRAARLQMALGGWKAEHGELPERLDQLIGPYLEELPVDPFTLQPFEYSPEADPPALRVLTSPGRYSHYLRREDLVFEIPVDD